MKKYETVKEHKDFEYIIHNCPFKKSKNFIIYNKDNDLAYSRFGIAVSKKTCNAVKRNHIKRKIRENYRLIQDQLKQGYNIVFLWNKKVPVEQVNFHIIKSDMEKSFTKAGLL